MDQRKENKKLAHDLKVWCRLDFLQGAGVGEFGTRLTGEEGVCVGVTPYPEFVTDTVCNGWGLRGNQHPPDTLHELLPENTLVV